jgi:putative cardiolipin synthase
MLATLIGSRLPQKYRKYFKLPEQPASWKFSDTGETALGRATAQWLYRHDSRCGVYRLDLGLDALGVRLGLIDAAERSIDIQSYLIRDDLSGNLVAMKLVEAAARGVRVRLLMDDALTEAIDAGLLNLDDHDNIEVRVFNPFPRRRSRIISYIAYFNILNRRMHNKSFTVDNQVSIVGGRNLADEYFQTGSFEEFIDEDVLAIGAIVDDISDGFDEYWNTPEAIPISVFDKVIRTRPFASIAVDSRAYLERHSNSPYLSQVSDIIVEQLLAARLPLTRADAELVLDHPEKIRKIVNRPVSQTSQYLLDMVSTAQDEVIIVSPYFVPQKQGIEYFHKLIQRGVRIVIITNSLASTNHSSVHAAYARYRKPLLREGIELYELRHLLAAHEVPGRSNNAAKLTLHSKVAVVDGRHMFVGSFNLDPRSLYINTEMGIGVRSRGFATTMASSIEESLPQWAYRLVLGPNEKLQWKYRTRGGERTVVQEPHTSIWRRAATRLMSFFPIESQM